MMQYVDTPPNGVASYAPAREGPFRCDRCRFQRALMCHRPETVAEAKQYRGLIPTATMVRVEGGACCDYFKQRTNGA